jgi:hypothetical protein
MSSSLSRNPFSFPVHPADTKQGTFVWNKRTPICGCSANPRRVKTVGFTESNSNFEEADLQRPDRPTKASRRHFVTQGWLIGSVRHRLAHRRADVTAFGQSKSKPDHLGHYKKLNGQKANFISCLVTKFQLNT